MAKTTIVLRGNLGRDLENKTSKAGKPYTSLTVGSTPSKKVNGEWENGETMWFNVTVFDELNPFEFKKGAPVEVEGTFTFRTFTKKDGSQGYALDVAANSIKVVAKDKQQVKEFEPAVIPTDWTPVDEMPF